MEANILQGYDNALAMLDIEKLSTRREVLCKKLALKAIKSDKYSSRFVTEENT